MSYPMRSLLLRQHETASALLHYHLDTLTTAECLWRPAGRGLHVHQSAGGRWAADWPDHEGYDLGPPSIAWTTWHVGFWWSMVIDHSFGQGSLKREDIDWPGSAEAASSWIAGLESRWLDAVGGLDDNQLASTRLCRWPLKDRPFADVVAWATVELAKNAAEIGLVRFLYAVRD